MLQQKQHTSFVISINKHIFFLSNHLPTITNCIYSLITNSYCYQNEIYHDKFVAEKKPISS